MLSRLHFIFVGLTLLIAVTLVAGCSTPPATPEPDRVATQVAEALSVAQTLTAVAQKAPIPTTEVAQITSTFTPVPATSTPVATDTSLPPTPRPTETRAPTLMPSYGYPYTVLPGETLSSISARTGVSAFAIAQANHITTYSAVYAGMVLWIPCGATPCAPTALPPTLIPPIVMPSTGVCAYYHPVSFGETLYSIARRYGITPQALMTVNNIYNPNLIYAGQTLCIPVGASISGPIPVPYPRPIAPTPVPYPTPY